MKSTTKTDAIFNSKFITIIKTFSEEEIKSFGAWLQSPWCNSNKNLVRLWGKIKKYYPHFEETKLTKEKLFKQILPHGKFSDRRMNNLFSEAYLAAEKFLVFQNFSKNENLQKDLLTKELQNRHLDGWFFKSAEKEIARLEEKEIKDWEDHLSLLQLHRRIYHHPTQTPRMQPGGLTIVKMGAQLNLVYLLEKAAIINEKIFRNRILKKENHDIETELKKWLIASEGVEHLALDFYRRRFAYTEKNKLEEHFKLQKDFFERFEELNKKEQKIHFLSLMNDAFNLRKKGLLSPEDLIPLFKLGLKTAFLLNKGQMTRMTFTSIVSIGNLVKAYDFTAHVIEKYSKCLQENLQEDAKKWATAHTFSKKGAFEQCLEILLSHEFSSIDFQTLTRMLTLQTYFELFLKSPNSYELYFFSYCDSSERWFNREGLKSGLVREGFIRFIQKSRALGKIYTDADFNKEKLEKLFQNKQNIQGLNWLFEKQMQILEILKK